MYIHDTADALVDKFKGNFVDSSNDTLLKAQYIEQASLLPNECVDLKMDIELVKRVFSL